VLIVSFVISQWSCRSVNGAQFTVIQGYRAPIATRTIFGRLFDQWASLFGFTLTNGCSELERGWWRVVLRIAVCRVSNCVIVGNWGDRRGCGDKARGCPGEVYQGPCTIAPLRVNSATNQAGGRRLLFRPDELHYQHNSATSGGGADSCTLINCIITGNSAAATAAVSRIATRPIV